MLQKNELEIRKVFNEIYVHNVESVQYFLTIPIWSYP